MCRTTIFTLITIIASFTFSFSQMNNDSLEFYRYNIISSDFKIVDSVIIDSICFQARYVNQKGIIYTDTTVECKTYTYKYYFPLRYTSELDDLKVDTLEFYWLYEGLGEFNLPILWNSNIEHEIIRISVFKDTLPEVYTIHFFEEYTIVEKKIATYGRWYVDIDKVYDLEMFKINDCKSNRIRKLVNEILEDHHAGFDNNRFGKNYVIEHKINGKYQFATTDDFILSQLSNKRKFNRVLNNLK